MRNVICTKLALAKTATDLLPTRQTRLQPTSTFCTCETILWLSCTTVRLQSVGTRLCNVVRHLDAGFGPQCGSTTATCGFSSAPRMTRRGTPHIHIPPVGVLRGRLPGDAPALFEQRRAAAGGRPKSQHRALAGRLHWARELSTRRPSSSTDSATD